MSALEIYSGNSALAETPIRATTDDEKHAALAYLARKGESDLAEMLGLA